MCHRERRQPSHRERSRTTASLSSGLLALAAILAACGGDSNPGTPAPTHTSSVVMSGATCPPPSPVPTPLHPVLIYPMPGATAVPDNLAAVIFAGTYDATYGPGYYTLTASTGSPVPVGTPTTAPSPLPSPAASLPPDYVADRIPYTALPIAASLSAATTYTFAFTETGYNAGNPPVCRTVNSYSVGSFTTQ